MSAGCLGLEASLVDSGFIHWWPNLGQALLVMPVLDVMDGGNLFVEQPCCPYRTSEAGEWAVSCPQREREGLVFSLPPVSQVLGQDG